MNEPNNQTPQQLPYYGYCQPSVRKPPLREVGTKRDMIYALFFLIFTLLATNFFLWGGRGAAASCASIGLFLSGVFYLMPHRVRLSRYALCCIVLYILCALSLAFSDDPFGKNCVMVMMILLSSTVVMELLNLRRYTAGTFRAIGDWCLTAFVYSFGSIGAVFYALFHRKNADGQVQKRNTGSILLGIGCAIPVLIVVIPLLISADDAFENLLKKLTFDGSFEAFTTLFFGLAMFLLLFGQHFAAIHEPVVPQTEAPARKGIDPMSMTAFFSVISAIYVLYLFSQLAYFFSAFSGLLPDSFSVAQYARRGFFEMVFICLINLGLVTAALLTVRKKNGKEPTVILIFALFLCAFSLLLIATAMSKMFLYIDSFGMTRLRIVTSVFMVFLAVVFITVALRLFLRKLPYLKVALITAAILIAAVGFADLDRAIAKYNVEAYLSGKLDDVDMTELAQMSSDSIVEYVWDLTDVGGDIAEDAYRILFDHLLSHDLAEHYGNFSTPAVTKSTYDWRRWNLPEYEAYCFLRKHAQEIVDGYITYVLD